MQKGCDQGRLLAFKFTLPSPPPFPHLPSVLSPLNLSHPPTPPEGALQALLAVAPSRRPPVASLTTSPYFQEDVLLRALRFLDTLLQREASQKVLGGEYEVVWPGRVSVVYAGLTACCVMLCACMQMPVHSVDATLVTPLMVSHLTPVTLPVTHHTQVAFLGDLSRFWSQMDDRLLRLRVLPTLLQVWRGG